ncbi:DNA/RNA non-specific endonuclease [Chitinophaga sp. S165]|uniref:DNA/RNA non-specific endonuclease n=1 Tax=Chitinophaga sp. S165 TaxID=2135462 RepID=UPI000D857110|nr:DNA/RNA non-specific endonuclease [Chitinophaga sp. S165]PWV47733.1 DNA/RNA non-specific endonuclease [Chitinophaga sp. S165]
MNPSFERTTASSLHRSAADNSSQDGIAVPAVLSRQVIPENANADIEEPLPTVTDRGITADIKEPLSTDQENQTTADIEEPLLLDMDEDGVDEQHTLLLEGDILYLHSDKQTLSDFIARKRGRTGKKMLTKQELLLLVEIEKLSITVHTGRYGTKAQSGKKRKAPLQQERLDGIKALKKIALLLAQFNQISKGPNMAMKKMRPPSHQSLLVTKTIQGDTFCSKVVMEPLSIVPRDDGLHGSIPEEETKLWRRLRNLADYKRGHMLNEQVHGPGINTNLVPVSTKLNNKMRESVEKVTKEAVNANNKVVRFEAESLNWGNFKGAFGAPDERLLPSHFRFRVTQMTLIPNQGYDGSDISHWEENTSKKVIFEDTLKHDIPTDVVPGNIAFTTKTFAPGFYFHPGGKIEPTSSPNEYLLRGYFSINNKSALFPALAMDDRNNLSYDIINEKVTTKYKVPPGYHIVLPFGPEELEYILYTDEIKKTSSDTPAFLIVNSNRHVNLKKDFDEEKRLARERVKARNQVVLDQQAMEEQKRKQLEAQRKLEKEETEHRLKEQKKSDGFRRLLYSAFREESYKYEAEFNDVYLEKFESNREKILYWAGEEWKKDNQLYTKDKDGLLVPLVQELIKIKDRLLEKQIVYEEKEELKRKEEEKLRLEEEKILFEEEKERAAVIEYFVQQIDEKATNDHLPKLRSEAGQSYYIRKKKELLTTYTNFWRNDIDVLKKDTDKLLSSALNKLEQIYEQALKVPDAPVKKPSVPLKRKLEISKEDKKKEDEDRSKKRIPQDRFQSPIPQSNTTTFHNPTPFDPFKYNLGFSNNNQDRMEEEEKEPRDRFTLPPTQSNTTFHIPTPPTPFKYNQEFRNDRNRIEEDRPFNFNPRTQQQHHHQPPQRGDLYRDTARQIDGAALTAYNYYRNNYLKEQLYRLKQPLELFIQQPTIDGWIQINKILWEMLDINALKWFADKWLPMWDNIKPS